VGFYAEPADSDPGAPPEEHQMDDDLGAIFQRAKTERSNSFPSFDQKLGINN
jgi:hypothetical protein